MRIKKKQLTIKEVEEICSALKLHAFKISNTNRMGILDKVRVDTFTVSDYKKICRVLFLLSHAAFPISICYRARFNHQQKEKGIDGTKEAQVLKRTIHNAIVALVREVGTLVTGKTNAFYQKNGTAPQLCHSGMRPHVSANYIMEALIKELAGFSVNNDFTLDNAIFGQVLELLTPIAFDLAPTNAEKLHAGKDGVYDEKVIDDYVEGLYADKPKYIKELDAGLCMKNTAILPHNTYYYLLQLTVPHGNKDEFAKVQDSKCHYDHYDFVRLGQMLFIARSGFDVGRHVTISETPEIMEIKPAPKTN